MRERLVVLMVIVVSSFAVRADAADKYVRKGASGQGTSWTDAYGELSSVNWSGMSGSTLWIAAGSYTSGLPTLSLANVTIKRATRDSHGGSVGWSDAYDNQVTVTPPYGSNFLVIGSSADNTVLDGVGFSPWRFRVAGVRGNNGMLRNDGADSVIIRGIEFDGLGEGTPSGGPEDGLRWMGGYNDIIEHSYIHDYRQAGSAHNDGVQAPSCTNITFRYNVFKNNGMHLFMGDYAWGNQYCNGISIHHNVFYNDANGGSYNGIVFKGTNQGGTFTNTIDNNVFNLRGQGQAFYLADAPSPGCCNGTANGQFRNNILYNTPAGDVGFYSHSYNLYYGSSGPSETGRLTNDPQFVNQTGNNYALQSSSPAIGSGANLGYTEDILGAPITAPVDRGAYEYGGTVPPPQPPPPATPTLSCTASPSTVSVGQTVTYSATGSSGTVSWASSGATPPTGTGTTYRVTYSSAGTKRATASNAGLTATCQATVSTAPVTAAAYRSHGLTSYVSRSTKTTIPAPAGVVNGDRLFLVYINGRTPAPTASITPPAGFTLLPGFPSSSAVDSRGFRVDLRIYQKVAANEPASYDVGHSGGAMSTQGMIIAVSGASGTPILTVNKGSGKTGTASGLTVGAANTLVMFIEHNWDSYGSEAVPAGNTPSFVERSDVASSLLYLATGTLAAPGATGNKSHSNGNGNSNGGWQAVLIGIN